MVLIAGIIFSYTKEYISIDYSTSQLTRVLNLLGKEVKKEINLKNYQYITVLSKRFSLGVSSSENDESWYGAEEEYERKFEVLFLTKNHRGKFLIERYDTFDQAKAFGEELVKYTGKSLVKYAPKRISKRR